MDDDQQFCLRWNNHQSTLVSVFDTLLESGTLVDCTLAAEGKSLKAHKVVLSACSPYFASLLEQQYDKHPIFILKDVKFQELRAMMDYMYRGEVNISQDQLSPLLKAAESLQIKGLSDNRSAGSPHKPQQQQQQTNEHKQLSVPVAAAAAGVGGGIKLPISSGYTLESKRIRHAGGIVGGVGGGSASIDSQDLSGSREGSSSPTSRKRKKIRRRSVENIMAEAHEHSNSSSHSMQINSSAPTITSAAAAIASVSSTNAATSSLSTSSTAAATLAGGNIIASAGGGLSVTKKTESVSNAKLIGGNIERDIDNDDDNRDENGKSAVVQSANTIGGGKKEQNHKQRKLHHQHQDTGDATGKDNTEMLIEPKNEYDDGNDETVEDLTLDDEELEDLEQAGPSHGGGEGSSQGYAQWQVDRSQDEIFIATQEAAGQQRDPQAYWKILEVVPFHPTDSTVGTVRTPVAMATTTTTIIPRSVTQRQHETITTINNNQSINTIMNNCGDNDNVTAGSTSQQHNIIGSDNDENDVDDGSETTVLQSVHTNNHDDNNGNTTTTTTELLDGTATVVVHYKTEFDNTIEYEFVTAPSSSNKIENMNNDNDHQIQDQQIHHYQHKQHLQQFQYAHNQHHECHYEQQTTAQQHSLDDTTIDNSATNSAVILQHRQQQNQAIEFNQNQNHHQKTFPKKILKIQTLDSDAVISNDNEFYTTATVAATMAAGETGIVTETVSANTAEIQGQTEDIISVSDGSTTVATTAVQSGTSRTITVTENVVNPADVIKHVCDRCGKAYKVKGSLKRHKKYECGVPPSLLCKYCVHRSKYKYDLRKHILQRHPENFHSNYMTKHIKRT